MALPSIELDPAAQSRASECSPARVLLVEDNSLVLGLSTMCLEAQGHVVTPAANPEDALQHLAEHGPAYDLLVADLVLPGMNGYELAEEVLCLVPGIRVLFVSGYAAPETMPRVRGAGVAQFCQKPYTPAELARAVTKILGTPQAPVSH